MHTRSVLLFSILGLVIIFTILQVLAHFFYFYWIYWWFDWMMHFFAGLIGGMAASWVIYYAGSWNKNLKNFALIVLSAFVCFMFSAFVWEILEYVLGLTQAHESVYLRDVMHDLVISAISSLLGAYATLRLIFTSERVI